jgi:aminoglycoside 3-N-acetyltransferase
MHTTASLTRDLRALTLPTGSIVLVHSGFRAFGPVDGGPEAIVAALRAALGPDATIVAPTFTTNLVDPYSWPVPPSAAERRWLMDQMPAYDPDRSVPHKMGAVAIALWRAPGAIRSRHPVTSWAAIGPRAEELLRDHPLDDPEGVDGPVGRAWRADGWVLLLGVDHDADTTVHLAESMLDMPHLREIPDRWPEDRPDGTRVWVPVVKTTKCSDGFVKLRPHLEQAGVVRFGRVGDATAQLARSRDVVRVATEVLSADPTALLCDDPECVHCPTSRRVLTGWRPGGPAPG